MNTPSTTGIWNVIKVGYGGWSRVRWEGGLAGWTAYRNGSCGWRVGVEQDRDRYGGI